jgi:hypothetical protein
VEDEFKMRSPSVPDLFPPSVYAGEFQKVLNYKASRADF